MIPFGTFWALLILGWYWKELNAKVALTFVAVYLAGYFAMSEFAVHGSIQIIFLVILNIVLVLKIFGGDIRLR